MLDRIRRMCYYTIRKRKEPKTMAKKETWYKFTFADGYNVWCRGMDRVERQHEEQKHGKLISKEKATLNV